MIDWAELFAVTVLPLELVIRGSSIYWFLFSMFALYCAETSARSPSRMCSYSS